MSTSPTTDRQVPPIFHLTQTPWSVLGTLCNSSVKANVPQKVHCLTTKFARSIWRCIQRNQRNGGFAAYGHAYSTAQKCTEVSKQNCKTHRSQKSTACRPEAVGLASPEPRCHSSFFFLPISKGERSAEGALVVSVQVGFTDLDLVKVKT